MVTGPSVIFYFVANYPKAAAAWLGSVPGLHLAGESGRLETAPPICLAVVLALSWGASGPPRARSAPPWWPQGRAQEGHTVKAGRSPKAKSRKPHFIACSVFCRPQHIITGHPSSGGVGNRCHLSVEGEQSPTTKDWTHRDGRKW